MTERRSRRAMDPASTAPRKATVLLVEDEAAIRDLLGQVLEDEGRRVLAAPDGERALDLLRREKVDLVLLDLMLPRLDGYGVLDALARSASLAATPVIILTAGEPRRERLRGTNVVRVMKKPVSLDAFLQAVDGTLRAK